MPVKEEPPKREKPKREPAAKRARVEEDAEASVESEASEGFDEEFDEESEGKRNARVVSAGMLKKMTVNKDDMLLVTKNNRGNHHVFINVTRLQQLIRAEGRMIERDPFIAYLGRLPPQQFVSGALLDKAITASLRVQGVAQSGKSVKGVKSEEGVQTVKGGKSEEGVQTVKGGKSVEGVQTVKGVKSEEGVQTVKGGKSVEGVQTVKGGKSVEGVQTVKGGKSVEGMQSGKSVEGMQAAKSVENVETGKAVQQATEDAKTGGEKKRPPKRQTAPVESEPAGKRQAMPAVQEEGKEQTTEKAKQGEESSTVQVKEESTEWQFTGGETRFHSVAELMKTLPTPRTTPPPQLGSPLHAAKLTRKDAANVVGLRSPSDPQKRFFAVLAKKSPSLPLRSRLAPRLRLEDRLGSSLRFQFAARRAKLQLLHPPAATRLRLLQHFFVLCFLAQHFGSLRLAFSPLAIPRAAELLTTLLQQDATPAVWPTLLAEHVPALGELTTNNPWLLPALETFTQSLPASLEAFPREDGEWVARATKVGAGDASEA